MVLETVPPRSVGDRSPGASDPGPPAGDAPGAPGEGTGAPGEGTGAPGEGTGAPGEGTGATRRPAVLARARPRLVVTAWFVLTALLVLGTALTPLLANPRFYFVDDTQSGAYGIWYQLGATLRAGHVPTLLDPRTWQAGNIAAEGQWGLWNPLVLAIGVFVAGTSSALVAVSTVKVALLVIAGTGVFTLVRTYGVAAPWCAVAGVLATATGFTAYVDAPSWVTGLLTWALLPWFWAALRRVVLRGANPLPALVAGYLEVTVGYLNGTLALIAVLIGVGVGVLVQRRWRAVAPLVGIGLFCGAIALTIYLPGVLTQDVTTRSSDKITNSQLLNADLTDLATAAVATARPTINGFWGSVVDAPLLYVSWALPLAALVDLTRARRGLRHVTDVLVLLALTAAFAFGPAEMGPLRFPDRMLPFVATSLVLLLVIGLARARAAHLGVGRLLGVLGLLLASYYLTWSSYPQQGASYTRAAALAAVGLVLVWAVLAGGPRLASRVRGGRGGAAGPVATHVATVVAVVLVLGWTVGTYVDQHRDVRYSPLADFGAPTRVTDYTSQLAGAQGGVLVVGNQVSSKVNPRTHEVWDESLLANLWFLNPHAVMNTYSPVGFEAYNTKMCTNWRGETCDSLFARLFAVQRTTGMTLVDQLSVSTLQFYRDVDPKADFDRALPGWHVLRSQRYTVTWVRDDPLPTAGGVVWTSDGTRVQTLARKDRSVTFRVDAAPASGGRVVFSRLAWPGYEVSGAGASLGRPVDKYLLAVDVPAGAAGEEVTVSFSPPGWRLEVTSAVVAGGAGLLWSLVAGAVALARWRRRRRPVAIEALVPAAEPAPAA